MTGILFCSGSLGASVGIASLALASAIATLNFASTLLTGASGSDTAGADGVVAIGADGVVAIGADGVASDLGKAAGKSGLGKGGIVGFTSSYGLNSLGFFSYIPI